MALATAAEVRTQAQIGDTAPVNTRLDTLIGYAGVLFARYCLYPRPDSGDYTMEPATYTVYPGRYALGMGDDSHICILPTPPVVSVTSVHVDPEQAYGAATLLDAAEYVADGRAIELTVSATHAWSTSPRANKVVVSAGCVVADNAALTQACIVQVLHWYSNLKLSGTDSVSVGQGSRSIKDLSLLPEVQLMLDPYRLGVP